MQAWRHRVFDVHRGGLEPAQSVSIDSRFRLVVFLVVFLVTAGGGLVYDYSRPALYRASARLSVDPPGVEDATLRAQFAVSEAVALRRSEFVDAVTQRLGGDATSAAVSAAMFERQLSTEAIPQTNIIELRAEGGDPARLVEALGVWIQAYQASRKENDRQDEGESLAEAKHALKVADQAVDGKRREMDAFRQRYGITSTEREENAGAARLRGLNTALNDTATKEVLAEARLKAIEESVAQGKGYVRAADKGTIGNLEMRAVDLRDRIKDLEQDYTTQYLALDPKFKALKANLTRIEQQIETERQRSLTAAISEAQEELASAKRASQKIREQSDALKQESHAFSTRFVELKRMGFDLEQLQEARRIALDRVRKLESSRKPSAVRIQVLTAPTAAQDPIAPNYTRDAAYAVGGGLLLAVGAVWLSDYLRRKPGALEPASQPIIQIAYPAVEHRPSERPANVLESTPVALLGAKSTFIELGVDDVAAVWRNADALGKTVLSVVFAGVSPTELCELRLRDIDFVSGGVAVPGTSARSVLLTGSMRDAIEALRAEGREPELPVFADALGRPLSVAEIDGHLACLAHDAGLRHPQEITVRALHFTYAAFLARQGMRMTDLPVVVGRLPAEAGTELMRLSPPGRLVPIEAVHRTYPVFTQR